MLAQFVVKKPDIICNADTGMLYYDGINPISLENYIRYKAVQDQISGQNCTYVVYDRILNCIMAYFSLKAGSVRLYDFYEKENNMQLLPGIELSMFAVNDMYIGYAGIKRKRTARVGVGEYVYKKYALSIVKDVANKIGVNILYLFALPDDKLVSYYEHKLGFHLPETQNGKRCKPFVPTFDEGCVFMYQIIKPQVS